MQLFQNTSYSILLFASRYLFQFRHIRESFCLLPALDEPFADTIMNPEAVRAPLPVGIRQKDIDTALVNLAMADDLWFWFYYKAAERLVLKATKHQWVTDIARYEYTWFKDTFFPETGRLRKTNERMWKRVYPSVEDNTDFNRYGVMMLLVAQIELLRDKEFLLIYCKMTNPGVQNAEIPEVQRINEKVSNLAKLNVNRRRYKTPELRDHSIPGSFKRFPNDENQLKAALKWIKDKFLHESASLSWTPKDFIRELSKHDKDKKVPGEYWPIFDELWIPKQTFGKIPTAKRSGQKTELDYSEAFPPVRNEEHVQKVLQRFRSEKDPHATGVREAELSDNDPPATEVEEAKLPGNAPDEFFDWDADDDIDELFDWKPGKPTGNGILMKEELLKK